MPDEKAVESVNVGTWVKVVEQGSDEAEVFHIVENHETDYLENKISPDNPVGRALVGAKQGEEVTIEGPNGPVTFAVEEIGRP